MDALETVLGDQLDLAELLADANSDPVSFHFAPCSYRLVNAATGELWTQAQTPHIFSIEVRAEKLPSHFGAGGTFRWHKNCVLPKLHVSVNGASGSSALQGAAVQLSALHVLEVLSREADGQAALDGAGGAAPLVHALVLLLEKESAAVEHKAVSLLARLASSVHACAAIVDAGGVSAVLPLLFAKTESVPETALAVLGAVATHVADVKALGRTRRPGAKTAMATKRAR